MESESRELIQTWVIRPQIHKLFFVSMSIIQIILSIFNEFVCCEQSSNPLLVPINQIDFDTSTFDRVGIFHDRA